MSAGFQPVSGDKVQGIIVELAADEGVDGDTALIHRAM
jgi:hypothetical protein